MGQRQEKIMGPKLHKQKALQTFPNLQSKLAISLLEFFVLTQKIEAFPSQNHLFTAIVWLDQC